MARLPQPGADHGTWGAILNDYLSTSHESDGTIKNGSVTDAKIASGISQSKITNLSSDLAAKANDAAVIHNSGAETVAGIKTFSASPIVPTQTTNTQAANKTYVDTALAAVSGGTIADGSVTTAKLADAAVTDEKVASGIAQSKITNLTTDLSAKVASTVQVATSGSLTGGGDLSANRTLSLTGDNATPGNDRYYGTNASGTKGFYPLPAGSGDPTLGGDLSGTASNAQIAAGAVSTTELANSAVTDAKVASGISQAKITNLSTDLANKATDSAVVHLAGAETISGVKTYSASPVVPTPSLGTQAANKSYVDTQISGVSSSGLVITAQSSAYTAVSGNYVLANASGAGFTITMPPVANGANLSVKKLDSSVNAIVVQPQGGVLIDDQVTVSINTQWQSYDFLSDGTKWYRV